MPKTMTGVAEHNSMSFICMVVMNGTLQTAVIDYKFFDLWV